MCATYTETLFRRVPEKPRFGRMHSLLARPKGFPSVAQLAIYPCSWYSTLFGMCF